MNHKLAHPVWTWTLAGLLTAGTCGCASPTKTARLATAPPVDEERLYEDCPVWARVAVPEWVTPYLGRHGLPAPYRDQKRPIGDVTAGLDLWQANHFVAYREETARYLYESYSPTSVRYRAGTLPMYEAIVAEQTAGLTNDRDKAVALLRVVPEKIVLHPGIPPKGPPIPENRALDDEALVCSGKAWCNEQARVFARLCQVAGIPARLIFLFYANRKSGHVIAEFYADAHWCMADASYLCVFSDASGRLMSAAECHSSGRLKAGEAYCRRFQAMLAYSDERMVGGRFPQTLDQAERDKLVAQWAAAARKELGTQTPKTQAGQLWVFGVMDYPLPK
jgi:hypothetical protein